MHRCGVQLLALRCAGFSNVDMQAAAGKLRVVRVPAYSPHAVAEHTMGLLLTLNRRLHRAYIRTRDFNFSIVGLTGIDLYKKTVGIIGTGRIGRAFGISQEKMQEALCRLYIPARLEMVYVSDKLSVCVDSAHSGYSMQHLIEALREYHPKRVIVIFGCGGNRSRDRRFDMGEVCGNLADFSIVTTEHNRFETFESIVMYGSRMCAVSWQNSAL